MKAMVQKYKDNTDKCARYRPTNKDLKPLGVPIILRLPSEQGKKLRQLELQYCTQKCFTALGLAGGGFLVEDFLEAGVVAKRVEFGSLQAGAAKVAVLDCRGEDVDGLIMSIQGRIDCGHRNTGWIAVTTPVQRILK